MRVRRGFVYLLIFLGMAMSLSNVSINGAVIGPIPSQPFGFLGILLFVGGLLLAVAAEKGLEFKVHPTRSNIPGVAVEYWIEGKFLKDYGISNQEEVRTDKIRKWAKTADIKKVRELESSLKPILVAQRQEDNDGADALWKALGSRTGGYLPKRVTDSDVPQHVKNSFLKYFGEKSWKADKEGLTAEQRKLLDANGLAYQPGSEDSFYGTIFVRSDPDISVNVQKVYDKPLAYEIIPLLAKKDSVKKKIPAPEEFNVYNEPGQKPRKPEPSKSRTIPTPEEFLGVAGSDDYAKAA